MFVHKVVRIVEPRAHGGGVTGDSVVCPWQRR